MALWLSACISKKDTHQPCCLSVRGFRGICQAHLSWGQSGISAKLACSLRWHAGARARQLDCADCEKLHSGLSAAIWTILSGGLADGLQCLCISSWRSGSLVCLAVDEKKGNLV